VLVALFPHQQSYFSLLALASARKSSIYSPMTYEEITRMVKVQVKPVFLETESNPAKNKYIWAYQITILNEGHETVQLINRYWRITDGRGRIQEVRGAGVVGEQPILAPNESFDYTSGVPLETASGFMGGSFEMISSAGEHLDVIVPTFSLDSPYDVRVLN